MRLPPGVRLLAAIGLGVLCARAGGAQQRPLTTKTPRSSARAACSWRRASRSGRNARYPSPGSRAIASRCPWASASGLATSPSCSSMRATHGSASTAATDAPLAYRVPADATRTSDIIDLTVATKIRVCGEGTHRPAFAVRFATRLPNASNESGLGLDTTDFSFSILGGEDLRAVARRGQRRPRHPEQPARCARSRTTPSWAAWRWRVR